MWSFELLEPRRLLAATLVKDIVPDSGTSTPAIESLVPLNDAVVFAADDGEHGMELWRSDGTPEGTYLLKDIRVGPLGSKIPSEGYQLHTAGDAVYFIAHDGTGPGVWATDGTTAGTVLLERFAEPDFDTSWPQLLTNVGPTMYFAYDAALWKTDGAPEGTELVQAGLVGLGEHFVATEDALFFSALDDQLGWELHRSDGTPEGTGLVADIHSGFDSATPMRMIAFQGEVYFHADDGVHGFEVWKSDGTAAGTTLLRDLFPGAQGSLPNNTVPPFVAGGRLYLKAILDEGPGPAERVTWRTDGTTAGTVRFEGPEPMDSLDPREWPLVSDGRFFYRSEGGGFPSGLWVSDGTGEETRRIDEAPDAMIDVGGVPYFVYRADGGFGGNPTTELRTIADSGEGTGLAADLYPGVFLVRELTHAGGTLFLIAAESAGSGNPEYELWKFDLDQAVGSDDVIGRVWLDVDANGVLDDGEAGISNVTVRLRDAFGGELLDETVTDEQGAYTLRAARGREVFVEFLGPERHIYTRQIVFGGEGRGSRAARGAGVSRTEIFTVGGGFGGASAPIFAGLVPLDATTPWQNPIEPVDTDNNGVLSVNDMLVVVNHLRANGVGELEGEPESMHALIDVSGDNVGAINDLLAVVTSLRAALTSGTEGEADSGLERVVDDVALRRSGPILHDLALRALLLNREDE